MGDELGFSVKPKLSMVESRLDCHLAGIGMTIIKAGVYSERCAIVAAVRVWLDCHLAEIRMTIIKAGVHSERCAIVAAVRVWAGLSFG